jgi:hypothetical protein
MWFGFPQGYVPQQLVVQWYTNASTLGSGSAQSKIEYSLDGGSSWTTMECMSCGSGALPPCQICLIDTHNVIIPLSPNQDTGLVQVRAILTVSATCSRCVPTEGQASASISVADIYLVVQRPVLKLFLDVPDAAGRGDFDPNNPQSDIGEYVPGSYLDGTPVPVSQMDKAVTDSTGGQVLTLIAAYQLPNGRIVKPNEFWTPGTASPSANYQLRGPANTSQFTGVAMNYGTRTQVDFYLPTQYRGFVDDVAPGDDPTVNGNGRTARLSLKCFDYGGFTYIFAVSGPDTSALLRIPEDNNENWLPDGGWIAGTAQINDTSLGTGNDEDNNPSGNGVDGDGLVNFEEFRGVVVRGIHRRTNPFQKDLFISSNLPQNIGDANNLPVTPRWIYESEMNTTNRIINFGSPVSSGKSSL